MNLIKKYFLLVALSISIVTYIFWESFPKGFFYKGNAIFITMLCFYIFYNERGNFVAFCLFILSISNLLDEFRFNNTILGWNEIILAATLPGFWYLKKAKNARQKSTR